MERSDGTLPEMDQGLGAKNLNTFKLAPVIFLLFFTFNFNNVILQNQIIKQTCTAIYAYNESTCDLLGTNNVTEEVKAIEKVVQPYAVKIFMTLSLVGTIIPAIVNVFIGPWSDKFGRKPVILAACTGYFLTYVFLTLIAFLSRIFVISPWAYILTAVPSALIGGVCTLISGIYCYTADITSLKIRPYKLSLVGAYISLGLFLGSLASGYAFEATNDVTVFSISVILTFAACFYTAIFVDESLKADQIDQGSKIRGLFQWDLVKDMFSTLFKDRPKRDTITLWILIAVICSTVFVMEGSSNVFFLFVRKKFSWTIKDLTTYDASSTIAGTIGGICGILFLQKYLGFSPVPLALLGIGSAVIDCVIKATATYPWHLYLAVGLTIMKGIFPPMCRSLISSTVPPSDIGKIYSLATSFEFLTPLGAAPLYTYVYSATLNSYPGAFNAVGAGIYFICFILVTFLFGMEFSRSNIPYGSLAD